MCEKPEEGKKKVPILAPPTETGANDSGDIEALELSGGKDAQFLENQAAENNFDRREQIKKSALHLMLLAIMFGGFAFLMLSGAVIAFHMLFPPDFHFLPEDQQKRLLDFLSGGAVAFLADFIRRQIR